MKWTKRGAVIGGIVVFVATLVFGYFWFKGLMPEAPIELRHILGVMVEALFLACIGAGIGAGLGYLWDRIKP